MAVENDPKQILYRRCARNMVISGGALILFGVWSVVKAAFYFSLNRVDFLSLADPEYSISLAQQGDQVYSTENFIFLLIILILLGIDIPIRFYIGHSAVRDARGIKKKSVVYIVLAILMGIRMIMEAARGFFRFSSSEIPEEVARGVTTSAVINLTSIMALFVLIVSSIRLRTLRRKMKEEGKQIHIV